MSSICYGGSVRMNPEVENDNFNPMFDKGYPYKIPKVYLEGYGEFYSPQWNFSWDDDSVVVVRDKCVVKYTRSAYRELRAKNEAGEIVWMDGRNAPYENCWDGEYLNEDRAAYEYTITEYDLDELKKRKYKVVLEEEDGFDDWDLQSLSNFGVEEIPGSHFIIEDGVLLEYTGKDKNLIIPNGVTEIGSNAFVRCNEFDSIKIPKTVEKISCFGGECGYTKQLEVAEDNPKYYVQDGCLIDREEKELVWALFGSTIPDDGSVVKIGSGAFWGHIDLESIVIPDGVTEIASDAFDMCTELNSIKIPKTVEKMSRMGFMGFDAPNIEVAEDNPKYYTKDGLLIDREEKELVWAYSGTTIPDDGSVVKIGSDAFCDRSDLSRIVIPDMIVEIGDFAFGLCENLEEIILPVTFVEDAKRIFGRELKKDGDKWIFEPSSFFGF